MGARLDVVSACELGLIDMTFRYSFIVFIFVTNRLVLRQAAFAHDVMLIRIVYTTLLIYAKSICKEKRG